MPIWTARIDKLPDRRGLRFAIDRGPRPSTFEEALAAWRSDASFRSQFNAWLAESPYSAFRWETPPVTASTTSKPFEFVLLDSPGLARRPDPDAFAEHFADASEPGIAAFANLGGDATLIVPAPLAPHSAYGHLAAFVREAPESQRQELWRVVGEAMGRRIGVRPVWLNTAGAGVSWLHVRLDDRPKYYGFEAYRAAVS